MDIRTGQTYATKDEALAAGVPESDIAKVTVRDGEYHAKFSNKKYPAPHQSQRERDRRKRQMQRG